MSCCSRTRGTSTARTSGSSPCWSPVRCSPSCCWWRSSANGPAGRWPTGGRPAARPVRDPVTTARGQLALVALVQLLVLALWFSASAVVPALRAEWDLSDQGGVWLTAIVQIGFAAGAVVSAVLNLADRIPPPLLIAASALLGALATAAVALWVR